MNAGVVHQDVDATQALFDPTDERDDLLLIREVDDESVSGDPRAIRDVGCNFLDVRRTIDQDTSDSLLRQAACRGRANPDGSTGHDGDLRIVRLIRSHRHGLHASMPQLAPMT
jgi:hypothetical protein